MFFFLFFLYLFFACCSKIMKTFKNGRDDKNDSKTMYLDNDRSMNIVGSVACIYIVYIILYRLLKLHSKTFSILILSLVHMMW